MDSDGMCTMVACRDGSLRLLSSPLSRGFVQASTPGNESVSVSCSRCSPRQVSFDAMVPSALM